MANTKHEGKGIRTWDEAWDLALDNKGMLYQLLYKYVRKHSLPWYKGEDLQKELESYAWEGFFEACRKWDPATGYTLSSYAYPAVNNAMNARMKVLARMGSNMQGHYKKDEKVERPYLGSLDGMDQERAVYQEAESGVLPNSLADIYSQPWTEHEPGLEDTVIDAIDQAETVERIRQVVDGMSEPHRTVFTLMYFTPPTHDRDPKRGLGSGYTLSEVAHRQGRSTTWAKEVLKEALEYIKYQLKAEGMEDE